MDSTVNLRNKRVLVTGGAGFIGSELVRQLTVEGCEVIVVDNLVNGKRENLQGLPPDQVRLEVIDIRDVKRMEVLLKGIDRVYHLACLGVRHSIHSPGENHEVNATGTLNLLSAAMEARVERFVTVSSSEVYGTALWVPMTEDHPTYPMTVYGASKLAGEAYTRAFYRTYAYPTVVARPFNSYGPHSHHEGDSGEVIPKFMLRCMAGEPMVIFGDGQQTRDFIYVTDTARGILLCGCCDAAVGRTVNLGAGFEITLNKLVHEIAGVVEKPEAEVIHDQPRPGDTLRLYADMTLAKKLLGFEAKVGLKQGLSGLRDWYNSLGKSLDELLSEEITYNWQ